MSEAKFTKGPWREGMTSEAMSDEMQSVKAAYPHAWRDSNDSIWSGLSIDGRVGPWGALLGIGWAQAMWHPSVLGYRRFFFVGHVEGQTKVLGISWQSPDDAMRNARESMSQPAPLEASSEHYDPFNEAGTMIPPSPEMVENIVGPAPDGVSEPGEEHILCAIEQRESQLRASLAANRGLEQALATAKEEGRVAGLLEASKAQCMFCGDRYSDYDNGRYKPFDVGSVEVKPHYRPKQYVSNVGEVEGWFHTSKDTLLEECNAQGVWSHISPR